MTDTEFEEFIGHLHLESARHGDLGHEYWTKVIEQLKDMRRLARLHEMSCQGNEVKATCREAKNAE